MDERMTRAKKIAAATEDAYSVDRYTSWLACARLLVNRGLSDEQVECVLRSKIMRWAGDVSNKPYGRTTALDLARYLDANPQSLPSLFLEAGLLGHEVVEGSATERLLALKAEYVQLRAAATRLSQSPSRSRSATRAFEKADATLERLLSTIDEIRLTK